MDSLKVLLVCGLLLVAVLSIEAARVYPTHDQGVSTQINHNYGSIPQNKRSVSTQPSKRLKSSKKQLKSSNYHKKREAATGFNYGAPNSVQAASEAEAVEPRVRRDHHEGVTGPVHTFVKTDKHAHFKWGVRHHVGHHYG